MDKYVDYEIYYELCEQLVDEATLSYTMLVQRFRTHPLTSFLLSILHYFFCGLQAPSELSLFL